MEGQAAQNVIGPAANERAELLARMLSAIGLDEHSTASEYPEVLASLRAACKLCNSVERCTRALDSGSAATFYSEFCLNAPVLRAVLDTINSSGAQAIRAAASLTPEPPSLGDERMMRARVQLIHAIERL